MTQELRVLINIHYCVGMSKLFWTPTFSAWPFRADTALKSILWETLFLDQLENLKLKRNSRIVFVGVGIKFVIFTHNFSWKDKIWSIFSELDVINLELDLRVVLEHGALCQTRLHSGDIQLTAIINPNQFSLTEFG